MSDDTVGVFVPLWAMKDTKGDARDAMILAQITWWLQPSQREGFGRTERIIERDGATWLYMTDERLGKEPGMSPDQVYRARLSLRKRGLIEWQVRKVDGSKTVLVRPLLNRGPAESQTAGPRDGQTAGPRNSANRGAAECSFIEELNPEEGKPTSAVADEADTRVEARRLCDLLATLVEENGSKRPTVTDAWVTEADRLIRLDGRTAEQVERAIRWSQRDPFWRANVMSMPKLREKYDQLRLAAQRPSGNGSGTSPAATIMAALRREVLS